MSLNNLLKCINGNALTQRAIVNYHNCQGRLFAYHNRTTIGSSATIEFAMKIPSTKVIEIYPSIIICDKELFIDFYQDVTLGTPSNNVASNIRCLNQYSPQDTTITELWATPDIQDYGELNFSDYLPANKYSAGEASFDINWISQSDCYYSIKIVNQEASEGIIKMSLYWVEK